MKENPVTCIVSGFFYSISQTNINAQRNRVIQIVSLRWRIQIV